MNPRVSIILPVYNGIPYLNRAIKSVLAQTFTDFELLIINDCSTDNSLEIIKGFSDSRMCVIEHTTNQGLISTLQQGLQLARGAYVARIDADDTWSNSDKLKKQVDFLDQHPDYNLVGTQAHMIDENNNEIFKIHYPVTDAEIRNKMLFKNPFIHPSVIFRKESALSAGGYRNGETYIEDYSLWVRMGLHGSFANIDECLVDYRINTKGESQKNNSIQIKNSLDLIQKHRKLYPHYYRAYLKWTAKLLIVRVIKPKFFLVLKKLVSLLNIQ